MKEVRTAVWSKNNGQDDLKWYMASKQPDGSYRINTNLYYHKFDTGVYYFDTYITDNAGMSKCVDSQTAEFKVSASEVGLKAVSDNVRYTVSVSDVAVPGGVQQVRVAVWSDKGWQDDLKWYTASKSGDTYSVTFDISNHKTAGKYYIDVYAKNVMGKEVFIGGNYSLNADAAAKASSAVENMNSQDGTFDVYVDIESSSLKISQVQVAVWSDKDWQDDVKWYTASKQPDGRYKYTVSASEHKYDTGKYFIDSYATFENGIKKCISSQTYQFEPEKFLYAQKTANGYRDIVIKNVPSDTTSVQFAVWSNDKGQDDIKWVTAAKQADGSYKASINISQFNSAGTFTVHSFKNDKSQSNFLRATTFSVAQNELKKNGWFYEGGYKFYYVNDVKQTDVRSVLGAQSTYKIQVNRTCNTVTIYAKDGSNGYIIPVVAFACSVGLPQTPTYTGNYTVGAKYRWKTLMGPSWGQYATTVSGQPGVYFHSVAGANKTSYNLSPVEYNKLGSAASHGCIRLNVRDAKWIYDNVPAGSSIYIYDSATAGPLGKPATIKIPANQNWDPTDPAITG